TKWSYRFEDLLRGQPYVFQVRASNSEGLGPWSAPSTPVRTLTTNPGPPPAPRLASSRPPPGPLSLWLSIFLPNDDGGDPVSAVLLETREHSGARAPEWSRYPGAPMRELIVHVDGLKPRTHYSFRASAVNGKGSGDPGPPCRRVRTSLPRPPTWSPIDMKALASANTPKILANIEAKNVTCSVAWEEPHDNGAPIESYQVECTRLGATVVRTIGATMRVMAIEDLAVHGEYVFRVAGVNAAGRGDLGPWSAIVNIPDPHD
ncbi:unnamed protein product, partial [Sphacelaria rigidula]